MARAYDLVGHRQSMSELMGYIPILLRPIVLPIFCVIKFFRLRLTGITTDDPPVDNLSDLEIEPDELPEKAKAKTENLREQLLELGFEPAISYSMFLSNQQSEIYQLYFLHPTDSVIAKINYRYSYNVGKDRVFVSFISSDKSGEAVVTTNGHLDSLYPSKIHLNRKVGEPVAKLLLRHLRSVQDQGLSALRLTKPKHVAQVIEYLHKKNVEFQLERGTYASLRDNSPLAEKLTEQSSHPTTSLQTDDLEIVGESPSVDRVTADIVQTMVDDSTKPTSWKQNIVLLALSLGAFILLSQKQQDWTWTAVLLPVLLVHELSHLIMMQACGYRNTKIFFIPGFGAAAAGVNYNVAGWKRIVVALAGPIGGLAVGGLAGLIGVMYSIPVLTKFAIVSCILNSFNLLPVLPLDGGWVAFHVLFCRHPALDAAFRACGALGLFCVAILLKETPLAIVAAFILFGAFRQFKIGDVARRLREEGLQPASDEQHGVDRAIAYRVVSAIRNVFQKKSQFANRILANYSLEAYSLIHARPPRLMGSLFFSTIHVASFVVGLAGLIFFTIAENPQMFALANLARMGMQAALHTAEHPYQPGSVKNWSGDESSKIPPEKTATILAKLTSNEQAQQQFAVRQKDLSATARITLISPYLFIALPEDDEAERERIIQSLTQDNVNFAVSMDNQNSPYADLTAVARDEVTAQAIERELRDFSQLENLTGLIPPWSAAWQQGGLHIDEYKKARRTFLTAQKTEREVYLKEFGQDELSKQIAEAQRLGRRQRVKELEKEIQTANSNARTKALEGLLETADESLDRETIQLYIAWRKEVAERQPHGHVEFSEDEMEEDVFQQDQTPSETYQSLKLRMGSIAADDHEQARLSARRISVHRLNNNLALRFLQFQATESGFPGLADWLSSKGFNQLKFDINSIGLSR